MEIYTIGYEGLGLESFLSWLQSYDISVVADVRNLPLSRKKGFSKTSLKEFLNEEKIEYQNYPELGATKDIRDKLRSTGNYEWFFNEYEKRLLANDDSSESITKIYDMANNGERVALLCFERDAEHCHRKIVADAVKGRDGNGLKIKHIHPD